MALQANLMRTAAHRPHTSSIALQIVQSLCDERYDDAYSHVSAALYNGWGDFGFPVLWSIAAMLADFCNGTNGPPMWMLRAAYLRVSIASVMRVLRTHEWHADDLEAVHRVSVLLDDKRVIKPLDDA
jgi:hypothetical protein